MRFLIVLVTVSCAIGFSEAISRKRIETIMLNILDCKIMEDYVAVDIKSIFTYKLPKRYIDRCIAACIGEISGIMKDRKIDPDGVTALANKSYGDDTSKVEIAQGIASTCIGITDDDRCEAAFKIFECMHNNVQSEGISIDDL